MYYFNHFCKFVFLSCLHCACLSTRCFVCLFAPNQFIHQGRIRDRGYLDRLRPLSVRFRRGDVQVFGPASPPLEVIVRYGAISSHEVRNLKSASTQNAQTELRGFHATVNVTYIPNTGIVIICWGRFTYRGVGGVGGLDFRVEVACPLFFICCGKCHLDNYYVDCSCYLVSLLTR